MSCLAKLIWLFLWFAATGHMSLEIFQLALAHGKVKVEGHDSLAGLVTRALLYSEAGHALLNIIATGVDVIDSLVAPQTRYMLITVVYLFCVMFVF